MPRFRFRDPARLLRRVVEGEDEVEEEIGEVSEIRLDVPEDGFIHSSLEGLGEEPHTIQHMQGDLGDYEVSERDHAYYVPSNQKHALTISWGGERFTILFPEKGKGKIEHDLPIGKIKWIINDEEEE